MLGSGAVDAYRPANTAHRASRLTRGLTDDARAHAFVDAYSDAGLFGVYATAPALSGGALWSALRKELDAALATLSDEDVLRAQNALRARLVAQRGGSGVAHALLAHESTPAERAALAASVSRADVVRVASAALASAPVLAARGDVSGLRL